MENHHGTVTGDLGHGGRKGLAYDWRAVLAAVESSSLDSELRELVPQLAT